MTIAQLSECFDVSKFPLLNVIYIYNNHIDKERKIIIPFIITVL